MENKLNEECGVLGYYDFDGADTARLLHAGLYALQHRGLQSCGIVTNDDARLHQIKDNGTAAEVFNEKNLDSLTGTIGVAHVRYAPGGDIPENAQPLVSRYCKGSITLAHNGNIINARELREELEAGGAIFQSTNDTEVILHLIAIARTRTPSVEQAMLRVMERIEGADLVADARRRSGVGVIFKEDLDLIKIGDVFKIIVNIFGNQRKAADKEKAADKDKDADKGEQPVAHHAVQRL